MEGWGRGRRWSLSGVSALIAHGGLMAALLLGGARHPWSAAAREPRTEIEIHTVPPPPPPPEPPMVATPTASGSSRRDRPVRRRGVNLGMHLVPVSTETEPFVSPADGDPDGEDDEEDSSDSGSASAGEGGPAPATNLASPGPPAEKDVTPLEAAYLCTYQTLPSLPRSLYKRGRTYTIIVQMCITAEGKVSGVTVKKSAAPELDKIVVPELYTWRYKARIVHGAPSAFCYQLNIHYEVD
jgi:hypothetical protein